MMITYQDFTEAAGKGMLMSFVEGAIYKHRHSDEYLTALDAENYMRRRNTTVCAFQRLIYDVAGRAQVDPVAANFKCASGFFKQNVTQLVQYLLSNGVAFSDEDTKALLGGAKFDRQLTRLARSALVEGVAFAFYDFDHVEVFKLTEFVPVWDEETGALMAGIRYWQISANKPLRADIYTLEGVQSCIRKAGEALHPMDGNETPRPYKLVREKVPIEAEAIYTGINYPALPIVPCYGNDERQSEIVGTKENIDAYDLTKSGLINDISDMPLVYWVLENAGGMDEADLSYWKAAINRNKVAKTDDEVHVTANTIGVPYQAQEVILTRLEKDIYNDAMALNTRELAAGNVTATAIEAASEPLNNRADELEYCIGDCIEGLLALVGVADTPSFNRQKLTNQSEVAQMVLSAADYLDGDTVRKHLPFLTPDEADAVPDKLAAESMDRITSPIPETGETGNKTEAIE